MQRPGTKRPTNRLSQGADHPDITAIFWNAGGLTTEKFVELKVFICKHDVDVFAVAEAGTAADNLEFYQCPGYSIHSVPRARQIATGIIIGVKTSVISKVTTRKEMNSTDLLEAIELEVWYKKQHYSFHFLYNPPRNKLSLQWLESLWGSSCIVMGDLNARSTIWGYLKNDPVGDIVEDFIDSNPVEFIDNEEHLPTFLSYCGNLSHPDLLLAYPHLGPSISHQIADAPGGAGHKILITKIKMHQSKLPARRRASWNLKKADWGKFSTLSNSIITQEVLSGNIDNCVKQLYIAIKRLAKDCIPRGSVKKYKPFWTETLQHLKQERDMLRKEAEVHKNRLALSKLKRSDIKLKEAIARAKRHCYISFLEQLDFRKDGIKAHSFLSNLNNAPRTQNAPITIGGKEITNEPDIAAQFCKHYAKVSNFHASTANTSPSLTVPSTCLNLGDFEIFNAPFSVSEFETAMADTKNGKAAGPDDILPEFILHLGNGAKSVVLALFNKIWTSGDFPVEWKKSEIIPLLKKGKPANSLSSYRPIALTSVLGKIMERLALARLTKYLEDKKLLSMNQAGFRRHRSAIDQVTRFSNEVKDGFHRRQSTLAVFVDFSTAFDRVWRKLLLQKLGALGVHGCLLRFIRGFLSQRFIRVVYNTSTSGFRQTRDGVPQGSVISPMLFNIMIDDIVIELEKSIPGLNALLYADDLLIWATSSSIPALQACMNDALNSLARWSDRNEMVVNPSKTVFQLFSLSTKPPSIVLSYKGGNIERTDAAVYLGITLDNRLNWSKHINHAVERGQSRMKLLNRLTGSTWGSTQDTLVTAYNSYVKPAMTYGCELTVTASESSKNKLDKVQNTALRLVTGAPKSTPIQAMICQTQIEPIWANTDGAALILNEKLMRTNDVYWKQYKPATGRLKTQTSFSTEVKHMASRYNLLLDNREPFPEAYPCKPFSYDLSLLGGKSKNNSESIELNVAALETINSRYPPSDWHHIYTDGSADAATRNGGAGVFSSQLSIGAAVGKHASNFDAELAAIELAMKEIATSAEPKTVILVDSQAAILALGRCSTRPTLQRIVACLKLLDQVRGQGRHVHLQWIPSHCGLRGNEAADKLAKKGSEKEQPDPPLTMQASKRLIKQAISTKVEEGIEEAARGKMWEQLATRDGRIAGNMRRKEVVARFRTITGHDYLQAHLYRIGVVDSSICPLCNQEDMYATHLVNCPALQDIMSSNDEDRISRLYWAARRRMSHHNPAGIG